MSLVKDEYAFFTKIVKFPILTLTITPYVIVVLVLLPQPSDLPKFIGIVYFLIFLPIMVFLFSIWQREQHDQKIQAKSFKRKFPQTYRWIKDKMKKNGVMGEPAYSSQIDSPYIFYGKLYIPEYLLIDYEKSQDPTIEAIILHELGHIIGGDGYALETITGLNFTILFSSLFLILVEGIGFALPIVVLSTTFFAVRIILLGLAEYQGDIFAAYEQETIEYIQRALIKYEIRKIQSNSIKDNRTLQFVRPPRKKLKAWQQPFYVLFAFARPSIKNRLNVLNHPENNFDYHSLLLGLGILGGLVFVTVGKNSYWYFVIISLFIFYIGILRINILNCIFISYAKGKIIPPFAYLVFGYFFSSLLAVFAHLGKIQTELFNFLAPFDGEIGSLLSTYLVYTFIYIIGCFGIAILLRNISTTP